MSDEPSDPAQKLFRALAGTAVDPAEEPLRIAAAEARGFLAPRWKEHHEESHGVPITQSSGMCLPSSLFLVLLLAERGIAGELKYGDRKAGNGFRHNGAWMSHAWTEADGFIIDSTADQSVGAPSIVVTPVGDPRYRAASALPNLNIETAMAETWWADWQIAELEGTYRGPAVETAALQENAGQANEPPVKSKRPMPRGTIGGGP